MRPPLFKRSLESLSQFQSVAPLCNNQRRATNDRFRLVHHFLFPGCQGYSIIEEVRARFSTPTEGNNIYPGSAGYYYRYDCLVPPQTFRWVILVPSGEWLRIVIWRPLRGVRPVWLTLVAP